MKRVFICEGIRSPFGRYGGALAMVRPDDLAATLIKHLVENSELKTDPTAVDEVILGCANQAGEDNRNIARMSSLLAGLPTTVPGITVNRLCASGLDAIRMAANSIKVGEADVIIAGGVESMSRAPFVTPKAEQSFSRLTEIYDTTIGWRFINPKMKNQFGVDSMPETAENVATEFNVNRVDQDEFSYQSQKKTQSAIERGFFIDEILPISIPQRKLEPITVTLDEHPRSDTSIEKLNKLPTPFRENGTVTAGNSSGVNDGACVMILCSEESVAKYNLKPMAEIITSTAVGVEPRIMGMGPVRAVEKILNKSKLKITDLGVIELNEAFAAQALAVLRKLGVDYKTDELQINPNGGAIALGHPLGASGARLVLTLSRHLYANPQLKPYGIATMCVGVGQGSAMLLKRV